MKLLKNSLTLFVIPNLFRDLILKGPETILKQVQHKVQDEVNYHVRLNLFRSLKSTIIINNDWRLK